MCLISECVSCVPAYSSDSGRLIIMVSMKDVAEKAGVSVATVSHVFSGKHYVSPEVKERVMDAVEQLNYHINLTARSLKTSKTSTIGVVLPDMTKLFFTEVMRGILETVENHGYRVMVLSSYFDFEMEKECISRLRQNNVDAIILDSCCDYQRLRDWSHELASYNGRYTPVVFLEVSADDSVVSSVSIDSFYWSYKMTQYLFSLGKEKIMYVSGPTSLRQEQDRLAGFLRAMKEKGIEVTDDMVISSDDFSSSSSYDVFSRAFGKNSKFEAIQASNDESAIGVLKNLKERGIRVPDDIIVSGFDNLFPSTLTDPAITTISVPRYEMGVEAVNECIHHIDDPSLPNRSIVLAADMMKRASTEKGIDTSWELFSW